MSGATMERGRVVDFDESSGLGTIESDEGVARAFHCIEIADGSRTIERGAVVSFTLIPKFGSYEAGDIHPVP